MKNGFTFFLGIFFALALAWTGIVLGSHAQLGHLAPYFDESEGKAFPERLPGIATRGQMVYEDLGCAACHTQQVRRPDFGADKARGWGDRQSVARDYVSQFHVQLGSSRIGPDLANFGARPLAVDSSRLSQYLYDGHGGMPAYRFLFETRKITGERAANALKGGADGYEIVPTPRAESLVAYLQSLNNTYEYPEAKPLEPVAKEGEAPAEATKPAAAPAAGDAKKTTATPPKEGEHK